VPIIINEAPIFSFIMIIRLIRLS